MKITHFGESPYPRVALHHLGTGSFGKSSCSDAIYLRISERHALRFLHGRVEVIEVKDWPNIVDLRPFNKGESITLTQE